MTSIDHAAPVAIDMDKLQEFVFRAVGEVGATLNAALVVTGDMLGAGEARIADVVKAVGLTRFRRVAEAPFNLVFEARP